MEEGDSDDDDRVTAHKRFKTTSRTHTLLTPVQRTVTRDSIKGPALTTAQTRLHLERRDKVVPALDQQRNSQQVNRRRRILQWLSTAECGRGPSGIRSTASIAVAHDKPTIGSASRAQVLEAADHVADSQSETQSASMMRRVADSSSAVAAAHLSLR